MYDLKETATLKEMYAADQKIAPIAKALGKSDRSVISKLVSLSLYVPKVKVSKVTGGKPKTKSSYVGDIAALLELEDLLGLDKAPKATLMNLKEAIEDWLGEIEEDDAPPDFDPSH